MRVSYIIYTLIELCFFSYAKAVPFASDSVNEPKKVSAFTVLKITGNFNVVLTQSGTCSLNITANKELMPSIDVKNKGVTLNITMKADAKGTATLYVGLTKDIQQISITATGNVSNTGIIKSGELAVSIDGNAVVSFTFNAKGLLYTSSSSKETMLAGKAKMCTLKDMGESNIDASRLAVDNMNIEDTGDGDLKVYAHPELHVKITGTGNLTYYGNPRIKTFKVEGAAASSQITEGKK